MKVLISKVVLTMLGCFFLLQASAQEEELFSKAKKGGKFGLISSNGQVIIKPQYEDIGTYSDGLISFRKGELWGAVDKSNTEVIAPKFADQFTFKSGLAPVSIPNKPGYDIIDKTGKAKFHSNYLFPDFTGFSHNLEPISDLKKSKVGMVSKANLTVVEPIYDEIKSFSNDRWMIKKGLMYGFLNKAGAVAVKPIWEEATPFKNGMSIVKAQTKTGAIGPDGKLVIPLGTYSKILTSSVDNYLRIVKNKMVGLMDKSMKVIIPPTYQAIKDFKEGMAVIQLDGKYGAIDSNGTVIIKPTYQNMEDFSDGLAEIAVNDRFGFIDPTGKIIVKPTYDELNPYHFGVAIFQKNDKFGLIDKTGKVIAAPKYNEIVHLANGFHRVQIGANFGIIDRTDRTVVPLEYEEIGALEQQ